jgi:putative hydrolase of the HAD superfamily
MPAPVAVVFDLWGTLVPGIPSSLRDAVSREMAADLDVDPTVFAAAYRDSYRERFLGTTGTLEETVTLLARRCGGSPAMPAVRRAAARRLDLTRSLLTSDAVTLSVLDGLLGRGLLLALVSDSSVETPELWPGSPLAGRIPVTAFSCAVGARKPDPRLYLHAVRQLGVSAARCLFVGDGGGGELTGAAALGMRAVRLTTRDAPTDRYDDDAAFAGEEIAALRELLALPELARAT